MKNIYAKLFEFRKLTGKVVKSSDNPFFKTKYADLNSVIEATDPSLEEVGLIYVDRVQDMTLISELIDPDSGESITTLTPLLLNKNDMQQLGSAITYARRYARLTMLGLQAVDDDGQNTTAQFAKPKQIKEITDLMLATQTKSETFLAFYKVTAIKDLREIQADDAISKLKKKKEQINGTETTNNKS